MDSSLKETIEAFTHWRAKGGRASTQLKQMAVNLLEEHSLKQVRDALKVSTQTLKNWKSTKHASSLTAFVPLELTQESTPIESSNMARGLVLTLPHGMQLNISDQAPETASKLISTLIKELSSCSI